MESRKMVLKNLFTGQQWRNRHRENTLMDMERGEERVRFMERVTWKLTLPYVNRQPMGICCMAQETQTGALYQSKGWDGEGDGREFQKGGDVCVSMGDSC